MELDNPRAHIVFDCDGTLISSQAKVLEGVKYVVENFLQRPFTMAEVKEKFNPHFHVLWSNFGIDSAPVETMDRLTELWKEHAASHEVNMGVFEGIVDLLEEFSKHGFLNYVWTGRDRFSTLKILKELDLAKYFLDFRCGDDTLPKPHPQGLEELVGHVSRENIIVIGDSYTDLQGAHEFGCRPVAATWCMHADVDSLRDHNPATMVKEPQEFLDFVLDIYPKK